MTGKPVVPRARASQDIEEAVARYEAEGGEKAALAFVDAVERAFLRIGRHPSIGSLRYAQELDLRSLRSWPLGRFPFLIFFMEANGHVDVWRVLHEHRDLPGVTLFPPP